MNGGTQRLVASFLAAGPYAVVGASRNRSKYGNRVLRCYIARGLEVFPVNPHEREIEGLRAYPDLASLPTPARAASIVTPPRVTERIVVEAAGAGVEILWMQPGAESAAAVAEARRRNLEVIADGSCFLVSSGC